jgi:2-polyprenyl-3-methyl-5-hydroxy-6-metoxy-1,4-benzoquinol methylase
MTVKEAKEDILERLPEVEFEEDKKTYSDFDILRMKINYKDKTIQPMLFGNEENLSKLNSFLWEQSTEEWEDKMKDISHRGTFLKRVVLIPRVMEEVKKFLQENSQIIELGCGEGIMFKELNKISKNVSALDMSEGFIRRLKKEFPKKNFYHKNVVKMDLDKKFDLVLCSMLLLDIPEIGKALSRIFSMLNKEGILIIVDINSNVYKALGYYDGTKLIVIHDKGKIFHTEKFISGHTRAVHNYHPFDYYKEEFENRGLTVLSDEVFGPTEDLINHSNLNGEDKMRLLKELNKDVINPPFHILVLKK